MCTFVAALPRCDDRDCRGLLRPNVVFFGETLDSHILTKVEKEMEICDLCLVVSYPPVLARTHTHTSYSSSDVIILRKSNIYPNWTWGTVVYSGFHVDAGVIAPLPLTHRSARPPSFTQRPCLGPRLQPGASQWQSSICQPHRNPSTSRKSVKTWGRVLKKWVILLIVKWLL